MSAYAHSTGNGSRPIKITAKNLSTTGNTYPDVTSSQRERNAYANRNNPNHSSYQGNTRNTDHRTRAPQQSNSGTPNPNNRWNNGGNRNNAGNNGGNRNNAGNGTGGRNQTSFNGGNNNRIARGPPARSEPSGVDVFVEVVGAVCNFYKWYNGRSRSYNNHRR